VLANFWGVPLAKLYLAGLSALGLACLAVPFHAVQAALGLRTLLFWVCFLNSAQRWIGLRAAKNFLGINDLFQLLFGCSRLNHPEGGA